MLKQYDERIKQLEDECSLQYRTVIVPLQEQIRQLREDRWKFIMDNKLYTPIEELARYEGCELEQITLIFEDGSTEFLCQGETFTIENGHVYSFTHNGHYDEKVYYNKNIDMYVFHLYGYEKTAKVVGFKDVIILQDGEDVRLVETFLEA